jgi:hypothetical protein
MVKLTQGTIIILIQIFLYNGTVCIDKRDERPYGVQMVIPNEKLTNLKYELRMAIIHGVMIVLLFF